MTSPIQETLRKFKDDKYTDAEVDAIVLTHKGDASAHHTKTTSAEIDHTLISNIGTNSHSQIDTAVTNSVAHIADNTQAHSDYLLNTGDTASGDYNFDSSTLFIDASTSRVGIGTTSPGAKMHLSNIGSQTGILIDRTSGQPSIKAGSANGYLMLESTGQSLGLNWYVSDNVILAKGGGNVGIGTTGPDYLLDIEKSTGAVVTRINSVDNDASLKISSDSGSSSANQDAFIDIMNDNAIEWRVGNDQSAGAGNTFVIGEGNFASPRFAIETGGNVGIGTTAPQGHLDINTETAETTKVRINGEVNYEKRLELRHYDASEAGLENNMLFISSKAGNKGTLGHISESAEDIDVLTWTQDGNVGIGTASPGAKLDVNGIIRTNNEFIVYNPSDSTEYLQISYNDALDAGYIRAYDIGVGHKPIQIGSTADIYLTPNGGNVGIGTTSPNEALTLGADGVLSIDERAAAPSATAAHGKLWVKNTVPTELWFTDDAGTSTKIV